MSDFTSDHPGLVIAGVLALIGAGFWLFLLFCDFRCGEAWKDSGHGSRFNLWAGGCQVEVDGRWVPEQSYREMP